MQDISFYDTKDFNTIVLLKHHGMKFEKVEREGPGMRTKRVYVKNTPELQKLLLDFDNEVIDVNMCELMDTIEKTKDFVHR